MNDLGTLLADSARRVFEDHCDRATKESAEKGAWPAQLWGQVTDAGFTAAITPESAGGLGATMAEGMTVLRAAGAAAAPIPLAETMLAGWLLASAGLEVPDGPLSVAPVRLDATLKLARAGQGWHLSGVARRIPWASMVGHLAVLVEYDKIWYVARVSTADCRVDGEQNVAFEPRDSVGFDCALASDAVGPAQAGFGMPQLLAFGAAMRTAQIAGAMDQVLRMTVQYALERIQFGRPIGKFQIIQQYLAVMAGQTAAAGAAADLATWAVQHDFSLFAIAAAKARAGEAASAAATIAHQVHGAIGITHEHTLHFLTRRLWSWRDEFGSESYWCKVIGEELCRIGADDMWEFLTDAAEASKE
jgi:Acyl-CoA dehydrogenases